MSVDSEPSAVLHCANHPDVETRLRCSRCGKPICVRCVYQTPVGGRCKECAQIRKSPVMLVSPARYAKAASYGLAAALIGGTIWASVGSMLFGLGGLLVIALGYLVGEAVSRGADGRISRGLVALACGLTVVSVVGGRAIVLLLALPSQLPVDVRLSFAFGASVEALFGNLMSLLFVGLALVVAAGRVR